MSTPDSSKAAWKQLGLVVLPTFDTQYQPLCTLKISQRLGSRPRVKLWSEQPLSALKHSPQLQDSMPEVKGIRPLQKLSSRSEVSAEVKLALEEAFGLTAGSNHGLELEFHSRGVMQRDLERCIRASDRADDWMQLTRDSRSLFGSPSCAIITEVWYARAVKEESGCGVAVNASPTVPAELVAGGVLPGGAASAGGAAAIDVGSSRSVLLEAAEFHPVAFQFVLLSWKNNQWVINDKPSSRPQTKGPATLEADKEQAAQWAFAEPPGVDVRFQMPIPTFSDLVFRRQSDCAGDSTRPDFFPETFKQQLSACSTGMVLLSGAWLVNLPQEQRQHCGDILATQGYMQLAETEDSLLLCSPKGVQSMQTALMDAELQEHMFRGDESSSSRVVDDGAWQQQSQGARWPWPFGNSGAGRQHGQYPDDQGGAGQGPPGSSGPGAGQQGQGSAASALPADKCVQLFMSSHPWADSDLGSTCRPTEVQTSSQTGDMMVEFCAWTNDVQLKVEMHMEGCVKDGEQGTKLGFKIPRIEASAKAPPAAASSSSSSSSKQQHYFMHKVKLSLEVQQPNGIRIGDTVGMNHQRADLHTGPVQTVIMYKFKETTVSTNITASVSPSGQLSMSTAFKEAPIAPFSEKQLPLVTYHPAQRKIEANFGHGSKPCSVEIIRQPMYSLLCGDDRDLGTFSSNPLNTRDDKELCFMVQEVDQEWLANDGLHVKLALLAQGARLSYNDETEAASKIVRNVSFECFHMWAGAIIKLGGPLEPVKTTAGCRVHT